MNNFVVITRLKEFVFEKVAYYSVRLHDANEDDTEFHDFLRRMDEVPGLEEELGNLILWIEEIGDNYGADRERFFRHEAKGGEVSALPPSRRQMEFHEIIVEQLRLYCFIANEHVVFLFNGGIKTAETPQECPNLKPHFLKANIIARKIDKCFQSKDIRWNTDHSDIEFDPDLEIEI